MYLLLPCPCKNIKGSQERAPEEREKEAVGIRKQRQREENVERFDLPTRPYKAFTQISLCLSLFLSGTWLFVDTIWFMLYGSVICGGERYTDYPRIWSLFTTLPSDFSFYVSLSLSRHLQGV